MIARAAVAAALLGLTLLSFFQFPGHAFLWSDTQIYIPIFERIRDGSLYQNDPMAVRPHVSYTVYDETALLLRKVLGGEFYRGLAIEQFVFRYCGLLGAWLLAASLGAGKRGALLCVAIYALGATIAGPAVLTMEYEPVPRGFATGMSWLAVGLAAQNRLPAAGGAAAVAFLYHPPTTWPVLAALAMLCLRRRTFAPFVPVLGAAVLLFLVSRLQPGVAEHQAFFSVIDSDLEELQRLRGSYNFVSIWAERYLPHYLLMGAAALFCAWRLRAHAAEPARAFLWGLPLFGLLSVPLSYCLLEGMHWSLIPQFQPARALAFLIALVMIAAPAAAIHAARSGRVMEAVLLLGLALANPVQTNSLELFGLGWPSGVPLARFAIWAALSAFAALAIWLVEKRVLPATPAWAAACVLPFFLLPGPAQVRPWVPYDIPEVRELAQWARMATPKDAVFLFPDSGRESYPAVFRARSLRALYTDWKSGGQVNLLGGFGREWWRRWRLTMETPFDAAHPERYAQLGIDYLIVKGKTRLPGQTPVFANSAYAAYRIR